MSNTAAQALSHAGFRKYVSGLWPIALLFLLMQAMNQITDNPIAALVSTWVPFITPLVFIFAFIFAAFWVHQPLRLTLHDMHESQPSLEQAMATLPLRALKGFSIAGLICIFYVFATVSLSAILTETALSARMMTALGLRVFFGLGVLIPAIAIALTMAWMAKTRKKLSLQQLFIGNLEHLHSYPWFIRTSNRPWLIFGVSSVIPVSILGIFTWLMFGTTNENEQHFILMQAIMLVFSLSIGGIALVWVTSNTIFRITRELAVGLNFLRQGKFDGHVAVMLDDDMGELARGLNTALSGLKERDSLKDSLAIASDIQRGLMPRDEPHLHGYAVAGFQQSCYSVGGDYYDYIQRGNGTTWFVIADVAGKGYPAALTVANLQAMLHALANAQNIDLLDAASYINQSLHQSLQGGRFVTLFMAELNPGSHTLEWLNAGHIPPLLWQQQHIHRLEALSPPLGMLESIPLHSDTISFHEGDLLFACTDGITESRNAKAEMFGDVRLESWFSQQQELEPAAIPTSMLAYLDDHEFLTREDDITILCLKRSNDE